MDEVITKATTEDIPHLVPLINSAYRGDAARKGWTHEADLVAGDLRIDNVSLQTLMNDPDSVILKYVSGNEIQGCVYLQTQDKHLYLGMLTVQPEIQARGIGKKLLVASEQYARGKNLSKIEMRVITLRPELIDWYERHGYKSTDKRQPFHTDTRFGIPTTDFEFMIMEKML